MPLSLARLVNWCTKEPIGEGVSVPNPLPANYFASAKAVKVGETQRNKFFVPSPSFVANPKIFLESGTLQ